jgi:hypothetical protein
MSDTKRNPFAAALLHGSETLTIFSGGACLKVWGAHLDLQVAWNWFERGLDSADHCRIALEAMYEVRTASGQSLYASYYPNAADACVVEQRVHASIVAAE